MTSFVSKDTFDNLSSLFMHFYSLCLSRLPVFQILLLLLKLAHVNSEEFEVNSNSQCRFKDLILFMLLLPCPLVFLINFPSLHVSSCYPSS